MLDSVRYRVPMRFGDRQRFDILRRRAQFVGGRTDFTTEARSHGEDKEHAADKFRSGIEQRRIQVAMVMRSDS